SDSAQSPSTSPSGKPILLSTNSSYTALLTLSLHDALPIYRANTPFFMHCFVAGIPCCIFCTCRYLFSCCLFNRCRKCSMECRRRSEEHTSELQSRFDLVCRLLLEKKKSTIRVSFTRRKDIQ